MLFASCASGSKLVIWRTSPLSNILLLRGNCEPNLLEIPHNGGRQRHWKSRMVWSAPQSDLDYLWHLQLHQNRRPRCHLLNQRRYCRPLILIHSQMFSQANRINLCQARRRWIHLSASTWTRYINRERLSPSLRKVHCLELERLSWLLQVKDYRSATLQPFYEA